MPGHHAEMCLPDGVTEDTRFYPGVPSMTTCGLRPALGITVVYMSYLNPKSSTHNHKLASALKQLSVRNMGDVVKENSQVHRKYQKLQGPGYILPGKPLPQLLE